MSPEGAEAQRMAQQLGKQGLARLEGRLDHVPGLLRQLLSNGQYEVLPSPCHTMIRATTSLLIQAPRMLFILRPSGLSQMG